MPKVTQEYRDARRAEILDAARRCFLRDGFHETSMQDVFAEAGLSAGAVYRYFAGKDDMIIAIAEENLRDVVSLIHALAHEPTGDGVGAALAAVLEVIRAKHAENQLAAMAVLVWSEALRNPSLAERFRAALDDMRAELVEVVRGHQARGALPARTGAAELSRFLMAVIPGFILQLAMFGDDAVDGVADAARAMWPAPPMRRRR